MRKQIAIVCVLSLFIGNCAMPVQNDVQAKVKKPVLNKKKASVKIVMLYHFS